MGTFNITKGSASIDVVKANMNDQVAAELVEFADKVKSVEVLIVGAPYGFADDLKQGVGNLDIININGETYQDNICRMPGSAAKAAHGHGHH